MAESAAGRGRLRVSHADREQVIDTLKAAFVRGMLAKDEFDLRAHCCTGRRLSAHAETVLNCRWPGDLPGVGQEVEPLKSADARHGFWVRWRSSG